MSNGKQATQESPRTQAAQESPAARLAGSVGFLLSQLGFATAGRFARKLEPLGIEPRQFGLLRIVEAAEGQSQQTLAAALRVPPSRMVALVDDLEERGLVERRPDPADRRVRALHLTSKGRSLLERAMKVAVEHEASITAGLEPGERERLRELLLRIATELGLPVGVHPGLSGSSKASPEDC